MYNTKPIYDQLIHHPLADIKKLADQINLCDVLLDKIEKELKEDVPIISNQGNLIKDGIDDELDELRKIAYSGKDYLVQIQKREVARTGFTSLKIAYNKVLGYY